MLALRDSYVMLDNPLYVKKILTKEWDETKLIGHILLLMLSMFIGKF